MTQLLEREEEPHTPQSPRLTMRWRQVKLLEELDLSGLASWSPELADSARLLLVEYHVSSLELGKLRCTHSTEHIIEITDDTPFKEQFFGFPHLWWKRSVATCEGCWIGAPYDPARVHAVTWLC